MRSNAEFRALATLVRANGHGFAARVITTRESGPGRFGIKRLGNFADRFLWFWFCVFGQGGAREFAMKKKGGDAPALASSPITIVEKRWAEARPWNAAVFGACGRSSRASDRTVSTPYMRCLAPHARSTSQFSTKLFIVCLMRTCLFTAEVVSH